MSNKFDFSIKNCARCGENHMDDELRAVPFVNPPPVNSLEKKKSGMSLTHWATCPNTGDPIMVYTEASDE